MGFKRFAARLAAQNGNDPQHAALYDAYIWQRADDDNRYERIITSERLEAVEARRQGFVRCQGCGEYVHSGALTCGLCGWEL